MSTIDKQHLSKNQIFSHIKQNISLGDKNWFQTGGCAQYYSEPTTNNEFQQALQFAELQNLDIFMLGQGANILISDEGFHGLVIKPQLNQITHQATTPNAATVTAGAGTSFHDLIDYCLDHNLTNLEEFSGIPGSVGGSVYINLHYYEFFLADFLDHAQIIHKKTGKITTVDTHWFKFGYDESELQNKDYYLLSATFRVQQATDLEVAHARGRRQEIIRHRTRRFPTTGTCGSFFRNFLPHEVQNTEKKLIYVAYYLDKIGVKGELSVGNAIVSYQHANMIVNKGNATSSDIIKLAQIMQSKVQEEFGIRPQAECQLIGFKDNPLA
ncbi:MAG: UDP-N-acetylenolpyruvoylglucosamine reductase [Epsilonproteobacteria bacterium]|nr:UDP-N-acetylenolpyruvoylglucosamine reductase [Campylobacterota bacterium]|tara:strand:- start:2007 stop:2984 length:978 start_codon:yes stop_codon:yes gene_type:complete